MVLPFSRKELNLPRIEHCRQLRDLVTQQDNNFIWLYTRKYDKIQFRTTERELNEVFDRYALHISKQSKNCEDIIVLDDDNNTSENEDKNDDIKWFID